MSPKGAIEWIVKEHSLIKEAILGKYLKIWFTMLSSSYKRLIYIDGFAGSGYLNSEDGKQIEGSPLIALENAIYALKRHPAEYHLYFVEKDSKSFKQLENSIKAKIHQKIKEENLTRNELKNLKCFLINKNYEFFEKFLEEGVKKTEKDTLLKIPLFAFFDPFGIDINSDWILFLLNTFKSELLINLMSGSIIRNPKSLKVTKLLGIQISKRKKPVEAFKEKIKKECPESYVVDFEIRSNKKNAPLYNLVHISKNKTALKKMKEIMYSESNSSFAFTNNKNFSKFLLLDPGLSEFKKALNEKFGNRENITVSEIIDKIVCSDDYVWSEKAIKQLLKDLEENNEIVVSDKKSDGKKRRKGTFSDKVIIEKLKIKFK